MSVQSTSPLPIQQGFVQPQEELGHVERVMRRFGERVHGAATSVRQYFWPKSEEQSVVLQEPIKQIEPVKVEKIPAPDVSFEQSLLINLQRRAVSPWVVKEQFKSFVPKKLQMKLFEDLGRSQPLSIQDRFMNWAVRDVKQIRIRYREIGAQQAAQNSYLMAPALEKALQEKIESFIS